MGAGAIKKQGGGRGRRRSRAQPMAEINVTPFVDVMLVLLIIFMVAAPLLGWASWMLDGIFIGATRSRDMRNMMAVSFGVYTLCVAVLLPVLGNHGLWLAMLISFVARAITLALRYPALERAAA